MASIHHNERISLGGLIQYPTESDATGTWQQDNLVPPTGQLPSERSAMEDIHTTLGLAGMIPGVGIVPDLIDAGLYGAEGDTSGSLLSLAAAVPVAGIAAGGIRSGKNVVKSFPTARRVDPRFGRDVVTVEMVDESGKIFKQPFYKSSGTSGGIGKASLRKDKWEPFVGRGKGGYKPHQYSKGWFTSADDYRFAGEGDVLKNISRGMDKDSADLAARMGDWGSISDEVTRLDKLGYYNKNLYHNIKGPEKLNKFLTEQGVKLPFSK